jgi:hypothetical protein
MEDPRLEEKFIADVDRLLQEGEPEEGVSVPEDYSRMLNTARELADLDLSPQSRIRASLRRRLLDEWNASEARSMPKKKILPPWFSKRTVRLASVLLIAAGITLLAGLSSQNAVRTWSGRISEFFRIGVPTYAAATATEGPESTGSEGSSQYHARSATDDSVAYWDMHWRYVTLYGTMGAHQESVREGGKK